MDFTNPVSSRTRARRDLYFKTLLQQKQKKKKKENIEPPHTSSNNTTKTQKKNSEESKGAEWVIVDVEGEENLGPGFVRSESVSACKGSNAEGIEGVGSAASGPKIANSGKKKGKEKGIGVSGEGTRLGLKTGEESGNSSRKSANEGVLDRDSCTKEINEGRSDVGNVEVGNVGAKHDQGRGNLDDHDDDEEEEGCDDEVQIIGESWCPNDKDVDGTIVLDSSSESELESGAVSFSISRFRGKPVEDNCEKRSVEVSERACSGGSKDEEADDRKVVSCELESSSNGDEGADDDAIAVSSESSKNNDKWTEKGKVVSSELELSSDEDEGVDDMDYEMEDSVSSEDSDSDDEVEVQEEEAKEDSDGDDVALMADSFDGSGVKRKRADGLDVLVTGKVMEESVDDEMFNSVARRTRSRFKSALPLTKLTSFGTLSCPFVIEDDVILSSPERDEQNNDRHSGRNRLNTVNCRTDRIKKSQTSENRRKRTRSSKKSDDDGRVCEVEEDETCDHHDTNGVSSEKHYNDQPKSSNEEKSESKDVKDATLKKKGKSEGNVCNNEVNKEENKVVVLEDGDSDVNAGVHSKPGSTGCSKRSNKGLPYMTTEKQAMTDAPRKKRCISQLKDYDIHEILVNSIMAAGELDALLDSQREAENEPSVADEPLQWKFTFGIEQPESLLQSEVDEELDSIWKELDLCLATSGIGSSDSCSLASDEGTHSELTTNQESLCRQGKHQLVLDEEIGMKCRFCSHVNLEIKHVMSCFNENLFRKSDWRERVASSILENPQFEGFGCGSPGSRYDPDFPYTGTVWDVIPGIKRGMYPHQREGFEFLWRNIAGSTELDELSEPSKLCPGGCIISHAPGTGKTRLAIVFLLSYMKLYRESRPVIIAPCNMLITWEEEFRKWNIGIPFHNLNSQELSGKEDARVLGLLKRYQDLRKVRLAKLFSWERKESILGLSYRLFEKLVGKRIQMDVGHDDPKAARKKKNDALLESEKEKMRSMLLKLPGLLVLDEGHIPRNDDSLIFRHLSQVETKSRIILSGTPFQNSLSELYNTLHLVRPQFPEMMLYGKVPKDVPGRRGRKRAKKGKRAFLSTMENPAQLEVLRVKMKPFVHVHKGTVLQKTLPGIRDFVVVLRPSGLQRTLLEQCQKRFKRGLDLDHMIALISSHPWLSTCFSKKEALCVDPASLEKSKADTTAGVKIRFLMELIHHSMFLGEKVLVFSQFIPPLNFLKEKLQSQLGWRLGQDMLLMSGILEDKQKQSMMGMFNDPSGKVRVLLASTRACSEGISLVGASRVVLLDTVWNPSVERQAIGRAYRIGQKRVVHVYHLIASGTHEEEKLVRQIEKGKLSELVFRPAHREIEEDSITTQVSEDKVLEQMVENEKLRCIFEKIYPPGVDSTLVESFGSEDT
ncbi:SNF2 domain-containing protein [Drosera capensis]